jgi:hypothetical protein
MISKWKWPVVVVWIDGIIILSWWLPKSREKY